MYRIGACVVVLPSTVSTAKTTILQYIRVVYYYTVWRYDNNANRAHASEKKINKKMIIFKIFI